MLTTKIQYLFLLLLVAAGSCRPVIDINRSTEKLPHNFFDRVPSLLHLIYPSRHFDSISIDDMDVFTAVFQEKYIEKDNLLTVSELGEHSSFPKVEYDAQIGYKQKMFMYHSHTCPDSTEFVIFISEKYNAAGTCLSSGPMYLGILNKGEGYANFLFEMHLIINKGDTLIEAINQKKVERLLAYIPVIQKKRAADEPLTKKEEKKAMAIQNYTNGRGIKFISETFKTKDKEDSRHFFSWIQRYPLGIQVNKIVNYNYNKVGGRMPVIFTISEILPDIKTLSFEPFKAPAK